MKTYLTYGAALAGGNALLTFALYFLGYHSEASKLPAAQIIGFVGSLAICITGLVLGIRARRAQIPPHEEFSYGSALGAGVMIMLFAALFSTVFSFVYFQFINPGFNDIVMQAQVAKMEAQGVPAANIEAAEKMMKIFMNPVLQAVFAALGSMVTGTIISLIAAAFLKRGPGEVSPPPLAS